MQFKKIEEQQKTLNIVAKYGDIYLENIMI